jgi:hypothetical protein
MMPDWLIVCMTGLSIFVAVFGRWRLALMLATPAIMRFIVIPLVWHYLQTLPGWLLAIIGLGLLPLLALRLLHRILQYTTSSGVADEAIGIYIGHGLIEATRRLFGGGRR